MPDLPEKTLINITLCRYCLLSSGHKFVGVGDDLYQVLVTEKSVKLLDELEKRVPVLRKLAPLRLDDEQANTLQDILQFLTRYASSNSSFLKKNVFCFANIVDISTRLPPLCSSSSPISMRRSASLWHHHHRS